jgi:hypothetical protein
MPALNDMLAFVQAIEQAFPDNAQRDRFGRYVGPRNTGPLQDLARQYQTPGAFDTQEQAGQVARAVLAKHGYPTKGRL